VRHFLKKRAMNGSKSIIVAAVLALSATLCAPAHAIVFGVVTCGSGSIACDPNRLNVVGGGSLPPSVLFTIDESGSSYNQIGAVTLSGTEIDVDALAFSGSTLFGYGLAKTISSTDPIVADTSASQLLSINTSNGAATAIGSSLAGEDMRGAAFDRSGNLWAVDVAADTLNKVNPATGAVLQTVALSQDVGTASDIAFRENGRAYISDNGTLYELNVNTGTMTAVLSNASLAYAGLAFSSDAPENLLFAYEVNGTDDLYTVNLDDLTASVLYPALVPTFNSKYFNAGRGDLAAFVALESVPLPAALPLFGTGTALLGVVCWRRRRKTAGRI
jgi:hypothetical protein